MISYRRTDWRVDVTGNGADAVFQLSVAGKPRATSALPRELLDAAAESGSIAALAEALRGIAVSDTTPTMQVTPGDAAFSRVTLAIGEASWSAIDWESLVPRSACFVRVNDTPPRISQVPLTFPIRILEAGGEAVVPKALELTFGASDRSAAVVESWCPLDAVDASPGARQWTTVDVLHLKGFDPAESAIASPLRWLTVFCERYQVRLLIIEVESAALPAARHLAHRLTARAGPAVWVLAAGATQWNGEYDCIVHDRPLDWIQAVLQSDTKWFGSARSRNGHGALFAGAGREELLRYSHLARELQRRRALQDIVTGVTRPRVRTVEFDPPFVDEVNINTSPYVYEFEGSGTRYLRQLRIANAVGRAVHSLRLRLVETPHGAAIDVPFDKSDRFSAGVSRELTAQGLHSPQLDVLVDRARSPLPRVERYLPGPRLSRSVRVPMLTRLIVDDVLGLGSLSQAAARAAVRGSLRRISVMAPTLRYEEHESEGMLPLAARIAEARALLKAFSADVQVVAATGPRRVNCAFFSPRAGGAPVMLDAARARLRAGDLVNFGVRISREDLGLLTVGSTALIDEIDRSKTAVELEIGLTAIDFECCGEPVQMLRLLPDVDSDWVTFAVRPLTTTTAPGVARLRVSVFHRNNLAQSFIVAALLEGPPVNAARTIARALDASPGQVKALGELGYVTRMEYSARPVDDTEAGPRALSIIANRSAGEKVITIKGDEVFRFTRDSNLPDLVQDLRDALDAASTEKDGKTYGYRDGAEDNTGKREALTDRLWNIASAGYALFNTLVPDLDEQALVRAKVVGAPAIHAANVSVTSVVPWALIYDRPVRDRETAIDPVALKTRKVAKALCPASMPGKDGQLPAGECGGLGCVLHESETQRRRAAGEDMLLEETVVCPRRFWGFSVPIEVPAQQKTGIKGKEPAALRTRTPASVPPAFCADFNEHLKFCASHRKNIEGLSVPPLAKFVAPETSGRNGLINLLDSRQPDVIYLFCHALNRRKFGKVSIGPSLDLGLGHKEQVKDLIRPTDFVGQKWPNAPLVFINGCAGAGFTPYAPSPFVKQFIQGRGAAAVIGAEVTVWEVLAAEFALEFFRSFLAGESAGRAMLVARRKLLAKNNPLGLVYTLYGSADLQLARAVAPAAPSTATPPPT
jgi:hypothetical protein